MKTTLLTLLFCIFITMVFAQTTKVGIEGGLNLANQTAGGKYGYMTTLPAFNAGITVDVDFKDFAFQPGILYSGKGHAQHIYLTDNNQNTVEQTAKTKLNYVEIPLNVVGKIHTSKNVSINLGGGPYLAMGLSASSQFNGQTTQLRFGENGTYTFLDYGVNVIAEAEFNNSFLIKTNYSNSIADISHGPADIHNHVFGLSVAYLFK